MAAAAACARRGRQICRHAVALDHRALPDLLARRDLREQAFRAWIARGENGGETDNREIVAETLNCAPKRPAARLSALRR
jgi:peptidyl-dipeptidase Dcp